MPFNRADHRHVWPEQPSRERLRATGPLRLVWRCQDPDCGAMKFRETDEQATARRRRANADLTVPSTSLLGDRHGETQEGND